MFHAIPSPVPAGTLIPVVRRSSWRVDGT